MQNDAHLTDKVSVNHTMAHDSNGVDKDDESLPIKITKIGIEGEGTGLATDYSAYRRLRKLLCRVELLFQMGPSAPSQRGGQLHPISSAASLSS